MSDKNIVIFQSATRTNGAMILKNIPNALTIFRLTLIVPFLVYFHDQNYVIAFYIFVLAGFTDGLDGWLARHFHWQSNFGYFLDPLADKLLVVSSFISLALVKMLPWWLVLLVFFRDVSILLGAFFWCWIIQRKFEFKPTILSKINTALQLGLVTWCLFERAWFNLNPEWLDMFILITALTTTASYLDYLRIWGKKAWLPRSQA